MKTKLSPVIALLILALLSLISMAACAPTMAWSG